MKNEICFIFLPDAIGRLYLEAIKKSNQSAGGGHTHTGGAQSCQTRVHPTPELPLFVYLGFNIYLVLTRSLPPVFQWLKQLSKSMARGFGQRRDEEGRGRVPARCGQEHSSSPAPQWGREVGMSPATCPRGSSGPPHGRTLGQSLWMSHLVPYHIPPAPSSFP